MLEKILLTRDAFERLIHDIVYIEEEKTSLLEYFPTASPERENYYSFIENYIIQVDALIRRVQVSSSSDNLLPIVIVNSKVHLCCFDDNSSKIVRLVLPQYNTEEHDISFLSPFGMALVLKEVGSEITYPTTQGLLRYRIDSIIL
ncbi:hypothetical protein JCM14036_11790 [Desulfotomaculum defluvii]